MKKTILYHKHVGLKAKMSPFGGFEMPIQYEGIIKEHEATAIKLPFLIPAIWVNFL